MKFLFKLIKVLLIFIIVAVVVPLVFLYFSIVDKTDNAPVDLYKENVNLNSELTTFFNNGFNLENKDSIDLTFTEDSLNKVIFSFIKKSNPNFHNPNLKSDDSKYISTTNVEIPVLGTKKVRIKNIYADIVDEKLGLYVTMDVMGLKTRAKFIAKFIETDDNFKIKFENIGLGKTNLVSGLVGKVVLFVLEKTKVTEETINKEFENQNLPFEFNMDDFSINISKDNIQDMLAKVLNPDDMAESSEKVMLNQLLITLTDKNNDITDFGVFDKTFGIKFDLSKFKVENSLLTLNNDIKTFDKDLFIKNKVQTFIISNLANDSESKMTFTNLEFNQIIYNQSNGYENFKVNIPLPNTNSTFNFEIIGIIIDFNSDNVVIRLNVNLNGLKTSIKLNGIIKNNNSSSVMIQISDDITIGEDIDENIGEYIIASSDLILDMLSKNIGDMGVMIYSSSLKSFIISSESFVKLMTVDNDNVSPLTVQKINIIDNGIEVYAYSKPEDSFFNDLNTATSIIKDVLGNNTFTSDDFNTSDEQAEIIDNFISTLDNIQESITNNDLSVEQTNELINNFNQLTSENQQIFLSQIQEKANSTELEALYNSLFGN